MPLKRKKYSKQFLSKKGIVELRKFCAGNKIPYMGLTKIKTIENINSWSSGATKLLDFSNLGLNDPNRKSDPDKVRILSIKVRRFCFEYSNKGDSLKRAEWAKRFECSSGTISKWLAWKESKILIRSFQKNYEDRIMQKFADEEEGVIDELLKIVKQRKGTDVKRKAINDFLGYKGRVNVNEKGNQVNVNQSQKQGQGQTLNHYDIKNMTEEEINAEILEISEMVVKE